MDQAPLVRFRKLLFRAANEENGVRRGGQDNSNRGPDERGITILSRRWLGQAGPKPLNQIG